MFQIFRIRQFLFTLFENRKTVKFGFMVNQVQVNIGQSLESNR